MSSNYFIVVIFIIFFTKAGFSTTKIPFNHQLKEKVEKAFFQDGDISLVKINKYRAEVKHNLKILSTNLKNVNILLKDKSRKKAANKVKKENEVTVFNLMLDYLEEMEDETDVAKFNQLALKFFDLEYALKTEGNDLGSIRMLKMGLAVSKRWKIPVHTAEFGEAFNLVNEESEEVEYFTQEELENKKKKGMDISTLNPDEKSTFWDKIDIEKVNIQERYQGSSARLYDGIKIKFPENRARFKKVRKTQSKPKLDILYNVDGKDKTFKIKIGKEMHSEPTSAALAAALGFHVDVSKYVKDFRIDLGEMTPEEFKVEWNSYYGAYEVNKYIKEEGEDESGHYIIVHEGLIENKPKKDFLRAGPWAWGENGHKGLRETRALIVFNMWVSNLDLKEAENNKLVVKQNGDERNFFHLQHDMGFAFGNIFREVIDAFKWNIIKKKTKDEIHVHFFSFQTNSGFEHITYSDARWMIRLISRLSRAQIEEAVRLGGWPKSVDKLLIEKLIARRNELVSGFDLLDEEIKGHKKIELIDFDRNLTTDDGVVVNGNLEISEFEGYTQDFGNEFQQIITPSLKGIRDTISESAVSLLASVDQVQVDAITIGLDDGLISSVLINTNRQVEKNSNPTSENDTFIVKDTLRIGYRFGAGLILAGMAEYVKEYTLAYPVKTREEGIYHNKFIVDLLVAKKMYAGNLPKSYVMMSEDYIKGKGRIKLPSGTTFPLGMSGGLSRVKLTRSFISNKGNDTITVFNDKSFYTGLTKKIYWDFVLLRIPLLKNAIYDGDLDRVYYEMDTSDLKNNTDKMRSLEKAIFDNDLSAFKEYSKERNIHSIFKEKDSGYNIFGFFMGKSQTRTDDVVENYVEDGETREIKNYQIELRRNSSWAFFDNGENHTNNVYFSAIPTENKGLKEAVLNLSINVVDNNTYSDEFADSYLNFVNKVALNPSFIKFNPHLYSKNEKWGVMEMSVNYILYPEAIDRLLAIDPESVWKTFIQISGENESVWRDRMQNYRDRSNGVSNDASETFGRDYTSASEKRKEYLANKVWAVISKLRKAQKEEDARDRMKGIVKVFKSAIYKSSGTYEPMILATIRKIVGEKNSFFNSMITARDGQENKLPAGEPLYNETGIKRAQQYTNHRFVFEDADEFYNLF